MRPIDLTPSGVAVKSAPSQGPSRNTVGAIAVIGIVLFASVGYFAWARVSSIKGEAAVLAADSADLQTKTAALNAQAAEAGAPVGTDYATIASNMKSDLLRIAESRVDIARFLFELGGVKMPGQWFSNIAITSSDDSTSTVTLDGLANSPKDIASLEQRLNATASLKDASSSGITRIVSDKGSVKWQFSFTATLVGSASPDATSLGGSSQLVSSTSTDGGGAKSLSLAPRPGFTSDAPKPKDPVDNPPNTPLETAAVAASGKGASS